MFDFSSRDSAGTQFFTVLIKTPSCMYSSNKISSYVVALYIITVVVGLMARDLFFVFMMAIAVSLFCIYKYRHSYQVATDVPDSIKQANVGETLKLSGTVRQGEGEIVTPFMQENAVLCKWKIQEVVGHSGKTGYNWRTVAHMFEATTFNLETKDEIVTVDVDSEAYEKGEITLVDNLNRVVCLDGESSKEGIHPSGLANKVEHYEKTPKHIMRFLSNRDIDEFNPDLDGRNRFVDSIGRLMYYDNGTRRYSERAVSPGEEIFLYAKLKERNITKPSVIGSPDDEKVILSDDMNYGETAYVIYLTAKYLTIVSVATALIVLIWSL